MSPGTVNNPETAAEKEQLTGTEGGEEKETAEEGEEKETEEEGEETEKGESTEEKKEEDETESNPVKTTPAPEVKSPHKFSANVTLVSDYRSRGISETFREPAVQGGFDYSLKSGFYLGTWASTIASNPFFINNGILEWDWYGGWKRNILCICGHPLEANVGLLYYYYPGAVGLAFRRGTIHYNTLEYYLGLTYRGLTFNFYQTLTNFYGIGSKNPPFNFDTFAFATPNGSSVGSIYVEAELEVALCKKLELLVHFGHQGVRHYSEISYFDWFVTVTRTFEWLDLFVSYVGTDASRTFYTLPNMAIPPERVYLGAQGIIGGATKAF